MQLEFICHLIILTLVPQSCDEDHFNCGEACIPRAWVCDNDPDCIDGSDESQDLCMFAGNCGGNFTAPYSLLTSPSYPDNYPINKDCVYTITVDNDTVIELTFLIMEIEDHASCGHDYIEIRDGLTDDIIDKLCGREAPAPFQSSHNHLWIK